MIVVAHDAQGIRLPERPRVALPLEPKTPIVIVDPHSERFVAAVLGAIETGAIPLLLPPGISRERALSLAETIGASALAFAEGDGEPEVVSLEGNPLDVLEPGFLACTSGTTTNDPSVYFFSMARARENARAHLVSMGLAEAHGLRMLMPLPLSHAFGFVAGVLAAEALSAELHVTTQLPSPNVLFSLLARERIELFHTTPSGVRGFVRTKAPAGGHDVSALRAVGVGSSSVLARDVRELARHFPEAARFATYGLTECGPRVATLDLRARAEMVAALPLDTAVPVGDALTGIEVALVDEDDHGVGELVVTSPYLAQARLVAGALVRLDASQTFRTADRARRSSDGSVTLLGRADGVVVRGGANVYPSTVEAVVERVPGVRCACLVGRASAIYGEVPVIVVEAESDERLARAIEDACARELTLVERPVAIVFVDALPRTSLGKIRRSVVTAEHGGTYV